ncbi:uncharacterized protein LOC129946999 isoform X2 [Eupeodes corollae]|nr:uncharacterized protein LOC129946999 isoform X2 [Eupeodes corollae]XP_055913372.1 uncharacterized protein LOC129946999 isoform X2 [Eupeodes corollae]
MLNVILWTPHFSKHICNKILKKIVKLKGESIIFNLSKSSRKIPKYTQYSMKIFLTSFIVYSRESSSQSLLILETCLQSHLPDSIIDLTPIEIVQNCKILILLYGCSFFKKQLRNFINAHRVLENLTIMLQNSEGYLNNDEIWKILRIYAYFSNYAFLSALEYTGVQTISEYLLAKCSDFCSDNQMLYPANKYIIYFAERFAPNTKLSNKMILSYISQEPSLTSPKIAQIIPSNKILHFICSSDYNQVVNAVRILKKKHLKEDDMDFIVKQCFCHLKSEEIKIQGALSLINKNVKIISACSVRNILTETIAFLKTKQKAPKYSALCYFLMMETCVNLVRFSTNLIYFEKQ